MKRFSLFKVFGLIITISIIIYFAYILLGVKYNMNEEAVAVFRTDKINGDVVVSDYRDGVKLKAHFTKLPPGLHGFHIHKAGDLRGEGCHGLCEHYDIGNNSHGGDPHYKGERHTGDLGNIELKNGRFYKEYYIKGTSIKDLWGRSIIVHADRDDLGEGSYEDSKITGHSGARIGCAIFGRSASKACKPKYNKTLKNKHI